MVMQVMQEGCFNTKNSKEKKFRKSLKKMGNRSLMIRIRKQQVTCIIRKEELEYFS